MIRSFFKHYAYRFIIFVVAAMIAGITKSITQSNGISAAVFVISAVFMFVFVAIIFDRKVDEVLDDLASDNPVYYSPEESARTRDGIEKLQRISNESNTGNGVSSKRYTQPEIVVDENEIYGIVAIPEGVEIDTEEWTILRMLRTKKLKASEILSKIPRSANIYIYKDALVHLEESGVIRADEEGCFSFEYRESYKKQIEEEERIRLAREEADREARERAAQEEMAELSRVNGIINDEKVAQASLQIKKMLSKRSMKAQELFGILPRSADIKTYKESIDRLVESNVIAANEDGTLFLVNNNEND